jgi:hypothetical protein
VADDASTTVAQAQPSPLERRRADRLAVFGITGDPAKVMAVDDLLAGLGRWHEPWIAT